MNYELAMNIYQWKIPCFRLVFRISMHWKVFVSRVFGYVIIYLNPCTFILDENDELKLALDRLTYENSSLKEGTTVFLLRKNSRNLTKYSSFQFQIWNQETAL